MTVTRLHRGACTACGRRFRDGLHMTDGHVLGQPCPGPILDDHDAEVVPFADLQQRTLYAPQPNPGHQPPSGRPTAPGSESRSRSDAEPGLS